MYDIRYYQQTLVLHQTLLYISKRHFPWALTEEKNLLQIMVFLSNGTRAYENHSSLWRDFPRMNELLELYIRTNTGWDRNQIFMKMLWMYIILRWHTFCNFVLSNSSSAKPKILSSPWVSTVTIHIGNEYKASMNLDSYCHPVLNDLRIYWAVSSNNIWRVKSLSGSIGLVK